MATSMATFSRASEASERASEGPLREGKDVEAPEGFLEASETRCEPRAWPDGETKEDQDHLAMAKPASLASDERVSSVIRGARDERDTAEDRPPKRTEENDAAVDLDADEGHASDQENLAPMQKNTPSTWFQHDKNGQKIWDASGRTSSDLWDNVPTFSSRNGQRKHRNHRGLTQATYTSGRNVHHPTGSIQEKGNGRTMEDSGTEDVAALRAENASLRALVEKVKDSELQLAEKEVQDAYSRYVVQFEAMADALAQEESRRRTFEFDFARAEAEKHEAQGRVRKLLEERQRLEGKIKDAAQIAELAEKERVQAEQAQKNVLGACQKLEEELQAMQAIQRENEKAQEAIHELEEELNAKQTAAKRLEEESEELAEELMQNKKNMQSMQKEMEQAQLRIMELEAQKEELQGTVQQEVEKVGLANEALHEAKTAYQEQKEEIERLKESLANVEEALEEAEKGRSEAHDELCQLEEELERAVERADDAEEALREIERAKQEREEEHQDVLEALSSSQLKVQELEAALESAQSECDRMRTDLKCLNEKLEGAEERAHTLEKAQQDAEERCTQGDKETKKLQMELKEAELRANSLEVEKKDGEKQQASARQEQRRLQETLKDALQRAERAENALQTSEKALEELDGEHKALREEMEGTASQFRKAQQALDEAGSKSTAFQVQIKELQEEVVQVTVQCQEAKVLQEHASAAQRKMGQEAKKLEVALEEALQRAGSAENALEELGKTSNEQAREMLKLQTAYSDALHRAQKAELGLNKAKKTSEEYDREMKRLIRELQSGQADMERFKMLAKVSAEEKAGLQSDIQSLETQVRGLESSLARSEARFALAQGESASARDDVERLKTQYEEAQSRNERLKAALEDAMEELISVRMLWDHASDCEQAADPRFNSLENVPHPSITSDQQHGGSSDASCQEPLPSKTSEQPISHGVRRMLAMHEVAEEESEAAKLYQKSVENASGPPVVYTPSCKQKLPDIGTNLVDEHLPVSYPVQEQDQGWTTNSEGQPDSIVFGIDQGGCRNFATPVLQAHVSNATESLATLSGEQKHSIHKNLAKEGNHERVENNASASMDGGGLRDLSHEAWQSQDSKDEILLATVPLPQAKVCPSPIQVRTPVVSHLSTMVDTATNTTPSLQLRISREAGRATVESHEKQTPVDSPLPAKVEEYSQEDRSDFILRQRNGLSVNSSALSSSRFRLRMHMRLRRSAYTSGTFGTNAPRSNPAENSRVSQCALASLESPP